MTLERLAEIEALLDGESDYHSVFITGEPVPSWALDVKTMREVLRLAREHILHLMLMEQVYKASQSWAMPTGEDK